MEWGAGVRRGVANKLWGLVTMVRYVRQSRPGPGPERGTEAANQGVRVGLKSAPGIPVSEESQGLFLRVFVPVLCGLWRVWVEACTWEHACMGVSMCTWVCEGGGCACRGAQVGVCTCV